jgi:hypothetical protein
MDLLITLAVIFLLALPVGFAGAWMAARGPSAWAIVIRGHQEDPWPVGVQEEDPDHHWALWSDDTVGRRTEQRDRPVDQPVVEEDVPAIAIAPVRSAIRRAQ